MALNLRNSWIFSSSKVFRYTIIFLTAVALNTVSSFSLSWLICCWLTTGLSWIPTGKNQAQTLHSTCSLIIDILLSFAGRHHLCSLEYFGRIVNKLISLYLSESYWKWSLYCSWIILAQEWRYIHNKLNVTITMKQKLTASRCLIICDSEPHTHLNSVLLPCMHAQG